MMTCSYKLLVFTTVLLTGTAVYADDVPCLRVPTEYNGYVCMCNATYCDTIESPPALPTGQFYHYVTSNDSPGFTKSTGKFSSVTQVNRIDDVVDNDDPNAVHIWIDAKTKYQTFKGLGVAVTDTSASLVNGLSSATIDHFMESLFGVTGVEYNFYRLPVASSDYSPSYYTQDDVEGDIDLKHWKLTSFDTDLKIPFYKRAAAVSKRGLNLLVAAWSAPGWMKTSQSYAQGYLLSAYHEAWAKYLLKFLKAYKDNGVDVWGITLGNEVILSEYFGPMFTMGNMIMFPAQTRYWVKKYFGPMMKSSEFKDVKIYALDDERPFITWIADRFFTDAEFYKYVDGVALHWYFDWNTTLPMMDSFHAQYPEKSIIYTESCINGPQSYNPADVVDLGNWVDAARFVYDIYDNLCHWSETYIDWTVALDRNGGPVGLDNYYLDAQIIVNTTNNEFYKQPIHYMFGHFSKFMPPGSQRVHVQIKQTTNDTYNEECSASSQNLNKKKSFEEMSSKPRLGDLPTLAPAPVSTAIRVLASLNPDGSQTVTVYNPRSEAAKLTITDSVKGTFQATVESLSLNSFIFW